MAFNLIDYYNLLNKDVDTTAFNPSGNDRRVWYINNDKRHSFKIFSDYDCVDGSDKKIYLPHSEEMTSSINLFSSQLNQKINNTKIVNNGDGTESIELDLNDRIITILMDNSGSSTWNDVNGFRYTIAKNLVDRIDANYPGNNRYNLISFGGTLINVLFFGIIEEPGIDVTNLNSVANLIYADDDANFAGIRVMRGETDYPCDYGGMDGDEVADGFIKNAIDSDVENGITSYYKVFTYDKNLKMSKGVGIKITPKERIIPRGISVFKTFVETDDIKTGKPLIGYGPNRDDYTLGLWNMSEGSGKYVFDFSDSNLTLTHTNDYPIWYGSDYVPSGVSGLILDGRSDYLKAADIDSKFEFTWDTGNSEITISAWIHPYGTEYLGTILARGHSTSSNYVFAVTSVGELFFSNGADETYSSIFVENYKWQYVSVTYDGSSVTFRINDQVSSSSITYGVYSDSSLHYISIGASSVGGYCFPGGITGVSIHSTVRSSEYLSSQLKLEQVYNGDGTVIDSIITGIKDDNGDRLVVLKYEIPEDYNFSGGYVRIVKNRKRAPSWEEDGTIIYEAEALSGSYYVADPDDFVLGETYYYRIFSRNSMGNFSFYSDSPCLSVSIPVSDTDSYFVPFSGMIYPPSEPTGGVSSIVGGNKKNYIRWKNPIPSDSRIKRTKIYCSTVTFPVVDFYGVSGSDLIYTAFADESINTVYESVENGFVHRNLLNDTTYYYTIVFTDKYGRVSGYEGKNDQQADFYTLSATPSSDADESAIPLNDVENLHYEIINDSMVSIQWDQSQRNPVNIDTYFDKTVLLYSSITDNFGLPISSDTLIKMSIKSDILKEDQSENVFGGGSTKSFSDKDAYEFFADRNSDGVIKATLKMTSDLDIISQIKEATFTVVLKAYLPKEKHGNIETTTTGSSIGSLEDYTSLLESAIEEIEGDVPATSSNENIFEYYSSSMTIKFTNPWEVELVSRDNQKVFETCYKEEEDPETKEKYLVEEEVPFNGVYMKADAPFIARCKVKYKGLPVDSGSVDVAVWDADMSNLCGGIGKKTVLSTTVEPPSNQMQLLHGSEQVVNSSGERESSEISYVDIPLYAPSKPHAVKLFVKATKAGYSSIKSIDVLFQSILKISQTIRTPAIDGKDVEEFKASVFLINPNYPNYKTNRYDSSLITYPSDNTIVEWKISSISGGKNRQIYSIDKVPRINGIFSYTRKGLSRNVFFGPIEGGSNTVHETHEVLSSVVYQGLTAKARRYIYLEYTPEESSQYENKFLMEVDGGYGPDGAWKKSVWSKVDGFPMWSDGSDFRRVKIERNPAISSFDDASCFRLCAERSGLSLLELSSGQVVHISTGNKDIEIIHGDVSEEIDPYTGESYLYIGEDGVIDYGEAYISLENLSVSDVTYFYIRSKAFLPSSGYSNVETEDLSDTPINKCVCLKSPDGLFKSDIPRWAPVVYVSGDTTVFVDNKPVVLYGGGDFYRGIPPCPISIQEPLGISTIWRKVIHYYYLDDSQSVLNSSEIEVGKNDFLDEDGNSYIRYNSDVVIRVYVTWRGSPVPENTPVYVSIGNNNASTMFMADRNIYYTSSEGYADITIRATNIASSTVTENVEIYTIYDKTGETDRKKSQFYNLTLENINAPLSEPQPGVIPDDAGPIVEPDTPYSKSIDRYNIVTDEWDTVSSLPERKGDVFAGVVNNVIYVSGGLKNNSLDISKRNDSYDPSENENPSGLGWVSKSDMITPRFGGMSVVYNNKIYTIGGIGIDSYNKSIGVSNSVEVYDPLYDSWEVLSSLPVIGEGTSSEKVLGVAMGSASLTFIGSKPYIYVVGGINRAIIEKTYFNIQSYNDRILRYSIQDDEWEYSGILRSDELIYYRRISPLSIVYKNKLIVFGGAIEGDSRFILQTDAISIDIESDFTKESSERWITVGNQYITNFPIPKFLSSIVGFEINPSVYDDIGIYYILGGADQDVNSLDIMERITSTSSSVTYDYSYGEDISHSIAPLPFAKHGASAVLSYSSDYSVPYIYLIGGYTGMQDSEHVDIRFDI